MVRHHEGMRSTSSRHTPCAVRLLRYTECVRSRGIQAILTRPPGSFYGAVYAGVWQGFYPGGDQCLRQTN